ncbi:hypothetical protein ACFFHW_09410 [Kushneria aurantia]|uniref:Transposase IS30-like HTH domain-containing protein n=1 Tax=Kushneria aurantia TaxID=504092 RepID=A0ABV6G3W2_9GAMM
MSRRQIARESGIHNSMVSRKLRQNATASGYDLKWAQPYSDHRRRTA